MKKILITQNTYTNYQFDFYESLKKYFNVKIYFLNIESENYKFKFKKNKDFYFSKNISLKKLLEKEKPNYLILGGIKHSKILNIKKDLKNFQTKYFFWLERLDDNFIRKKYYIYFCKKILSQADGILAIGNEAKSFYKKFNKNILNLQYSINVSKYSTSKTKEKLKINFLYVGQYIKRKGIKELLNAINRLSKKESSISSFTFVGEGDYKNHLLKLQKINKNIRVNNFQNRDQLVKLFFKNHVFIFPSLYDGWGVAPMEAMISGLYVIISNRCGLIKSNPLIKKYSRIINPTSDNILQSIKFCIKNRSLIATKSKILTKKIKNTALNSDINANKLNSFLQKL